jgi:hypothetical protein
MDHTPPRAAGPLRGPLAIVACATLLALVLVPLRATPARADSAAASLTAWVNQERASAGLPALSVASDLVDVATRHSQRMASSGRLYHNPNLGSEVSGWERVTENVGRGPDARPIHDAFMASSTHAANILDGGVTQVGVGVVWVDGTLWVTQVFRRPTQSSPPPPAPGPETEPEPALTAPTPAPPPPAPSSSAPAAPAAPPAPPTAAPSTTAPAETSATATVLTWDLPEVATAPDPATIVGPADGSEVRAAPSPALARVMSAAGWLVVLVEATDG